MKKRNIIIAASALALIAVIIGFFWLKTMPEKYLANQVEKLNQGLGGKIEYQSADFNSSFFPTEAVLKKVSFSRASVMGELRISSKEARVMLVDNQVSEIVFAGLILSQESGNAAAQMQIGQVVTEEDVVVQIEQVQGDSRKIEIKFPHNFVADQPFRKSSFAYLGDSPIVQLILNKNNELELLDYHDKGTALKTEFLAEGFEGVVEESEIDPIKILYKKSADEKGETTDLSVSVSLPTKQQHDLDKVPNLTEQQRQDAKDLLYFSDVAVEIDVSLFAEKTAATPSFINIKKLDLIGGNYRIALKYNGGTVLPGAPFPNGSGEFSFLNYAEFLNKLGDVYRIVKSMADSSAGKSQINNGELTQYLVGMDADGFITQLQKTRRFLAAVNASEIDENFFMSFAFIPPYNLVLNDKRADEIISVWNDISAEDEEDGEEEEVIEQR